MTQASLRVAQEYCRRYPNIHKSGLLRSLGLLRSSDAYDILAVACGEPSGFDPLMLLTRATLQYDRQAEQRFAELKKAELLYTARLLCLGGDSQGFNDGLDLFRATARTRPFKQWNERFRTVFVESLIYSRHLDEALHFINEADWSDPLMRRRLIVGATNPFRMETPGQQEPSAWLNLFNEFINVSGELSPVRLLDDASVLPYDRVFTDPLPAATGPLVTIIMSVWKREAHVLRHAVRSVINQTWTSWELLIVDDASGPDYEPLHAEVASMDPRIRLVRKRKNEGTYAARNTALGLARGRLIAFQDSDDWSHPERIQRQVEFLLENRDEVACQTPCIRVDDELNPVEPGFQAIRRNESSLLFWRKEVVRKVGFFDQARKGADSEYRLRIEEAFGRKTQIVGPDALALVRLTAGSLSRSELAPGFRHPSRFLYSEGFKRRHKHQRRTNDFRMSSRAASDSTVPALMRPNRLSSSQLEIDIVLISDVRATSPGIEATVNAARQLAKQGHRVGIAPHITLDHRQVPANELAPDIAALLEENVAEPALLTESWNVRHAVVVGPELLQFRPWQPATWTVGSVSILQHKKSADSALWDRGTCDFNCAHLLGRRPFWVDDIAQILERAHPRRPVALHDISAELHAPNTNAADPRHEITLDLSAEHNPTITLSHAPLAVASHGPSWAGVLGHATLPWGPHAHPLAARLLAARFDSYERFADCLWHTSGRFAVLLFWEGQLTLHTRGFFPEPSNDRCGQLILKQHDSDEEAVKIHLWRLTDTWRHEGRHTPRRNPGLEECQRLAVEALSTKPHTKPTLVSDADLTESTLLILRDALRHLDVQIQGASLTTTKYLRSQFIPFTYRLRAVPDSANLQFSLPCSVISAASSHEGGDATSPMTTVEVERATERPRSRGADHDHQLGRSMPSSFTTSADTGKALGDRYGNQ